MELLQQEATRAYLKISSKNVVGVLEKRLDEADPQCIVNVSIAALARRCGIVDSNKFGVMCGDKGSKNLFTDSMLVWQRSSQWDSKRHSSGTL